MLQFSRYHRSRAYLTFLVIASVILGLNTYLLCHSVGAHPHLGIKLTLSSISLLVFLVLCASIGGIVAALLISFIFIWEIFLTLSFLQLGALPVWYIIAVATSQETYDFWPFILAGGIFIILISCFFRHLFHYRPKRLILSLIIFITYCTFQDKSITLYEQRGSYHHFSWHLPTPKDYVKFAHRLAHIREQPEAYAYHLLHTDPGALATLYGSIALALKNNQRRLNETSLVMPRGVTNNDLKKDTPRHIIVIVGESSAPSRYGIYGYRKQTTPQLQKLLDQKKICLISNVHAAAPVTRYAVMPSLAFWTPKTLDKWKTTENIFTLAEKNGYTSYFLSAQKELGGYAGPIGMLAESADYLFAPDICQNCAALGLKSHDVKSDDDLLKPFKTAMSLPPQHSKDRQLIVIHIYGSHEKYSDRITDIERKNFPKFSPYDKSIAHTDRLIKTFLDLAHAKWGNNFVMVYFSDHGEKVAEGSGLRIAGHGLMKGTKQYKIPFISNSSQVCSAVEQLRNANGYYSSKMNIYPLISLIGYKTDSNLLNALKANDVVLHTDEKVYRWENIPH